MTRCANARCRAVLPVPSDWLCPVCWWIWRWGVGVGLVVGIVGGLLGLVVG
jgi:hypothetical protein